MLPNSFWLGGLLKCENEEEEQVEEGEEDKEEGLEEEGEEVSGFAILKLGNKGKLEFGFEIDIRFEKAELPTSWLLGLEFVSSFGKMGIEGEGDGLEGLLLELEVEEEEEVGEDTEKGWGLFQTEKDLREVPEFLVPVRSFEETL